MNCSDEAMRHVHHTPLTAASAALTSLIDGNERFANGNATRPHQTAQWRRYLHDRQRPIAAVLGCSDSRVPTEIVFDVGLGDLFVMRTAGHIVDESVLGSLSYAIDVLNVSLVVVVGHENCGAIAAAVDELTHVKDPNSHISPNYLVNSVAPAIRAASERGNVNTGDVERRHLTNMSARLAARCGPLRDGLTDQTLGLATMHYDLRSGKAELLSVILP